MQLLHTGNLSMKNRPKPNSKAAYASNGTNQVKRSTDTTPPLENSVPLNMDELAKLQEPKPEAVKAATVSKSVPVTVLKKDVNKAEIIKPDEQDAE